jgi:hypothetical protein
MSGLTPGNRLYGMMQSLLVYYANDQVPTPAEDRGVVEEQDALDAVIQLAGFLDRNAQDGDLSADDIEHMASMLMVIREFVRPLPVGMVPAADGAQTDGVTPDLLEMVSALRTMRDDTGLQG